jgi:LysM repeat protein
MENYVVQNGDTLITIAEKKLGSSSRWQEIAKLNNIAPPYQLYIGQTIKLPAAGSLALTPPNGQQQSILMQPATQAWGRGFMFVVFEQLPAPGKKVVRKVAKIPYNYGLTAPNPLATTSFAEHALGSNNSQFLSGSNKPIGAGSITGKPLLLDVAKIQSAGGTIHSPAEIIADLRRYAAANPTAARRVEQLIWAIDKVEGEVLIEGGVPKDAITRANFTHSGYIRSAEQLWADFEAKKLSLPRWKKATARPGYLAGSDGY